jgi:hypothetical protein
MRPGSGKRRAYSRVFLARLWLTLDDGKTVAMELADAIGLLFDREAEGTLGKTPRMTSNARRSIRASCSPYSAWKCGEACPRQNSWMTIPKYSLIVGIKDLSQ